MKLKRDDGTPVEIEYEVETYGHRGNNWDDAGEPTIVNITASYDEADEDVELTETEKTRLEEEIAEIIDREGPPDDMDFIS